MTPAKTLVVNCKRESYDVLIDRTTVFGNPFRIGQHGNREQVIKRFETYFYDRVERDPVWKALVLAELGGGKRIGCHCKPLPCHGDVYAAWLDAQDWLAGIRGDIDKLGE